MSQLRLTLLIFGVVFITALVWWERRRPRQASADGAERFGLRDPEASAAAAPRPAREPSLTLPEMHAGESFADHPLPVVEAVRESAAVPVLSPFAPLVVAHMDDPGPSESVSTDAVPHDSDEFVVASPPAVTAAPPAGSDPAPAVAVESRPGTVREELPRLPPGPSPVVDWPPDAQRQVVSLRLVATSERFVGRSLRQALAAEGFVLGRFAIFHKPDDEQRAVLSAASLTRPGTFDADTMDSQQFGGLSLFAVLPGPRPAPQAFEDLISAARNLNDRLHGVLQDERGSPLTAARIAWLRERVSSESP
ncbi:MAG: cell division protein ZipA C-terminal FtsZ-binding domain-containing protein [Steroidobacterales bacterium]|jgi:FtsZ-interacting cell division protein ZipA